MVLPHRMLYSISSQSRPTPHLYLSFLSIFLSLPPDAPPNRNKAEKRKEAVRRIKNNVSPVPPSPILLRLGCAVC